MNRQLQNEALARIEGYKLEEFVSDGCRWRYSKNSKGLNTIPDYDDLNVLHRIVCGMGEQVSQYAHELSRLCASNDGRNEAERNCIATPAQIREAILRAYGKWEES